MLSDYFTALHRNAFRLTRRLFAETWQGWAISIAAFCVGTYLHAKYQGWDAALDNATVTILTGFAASAAIAIVIYLSLLVSATYRLWDEDQQRLARQGVAQNHREIADELKAHCIAGQRLLQTWSGNTFNTDVRDWQKAAEAIVEKCGPEELAMFQTLYPPLVRVAVYTSDYRTRDKARLKGMIEKLRYIMSRQYQADAAVAIGKR